jgi:hypothetical protein
MPALTESEQESLRYESTKAAEEIAAKYVKIWGYPEAAADLETKLAEAIFRNVDQVCSSVSARHGRIAFHKAQNTLEDSERGFVTANSLVPHTYLAPTGKWDQRWDPDRRQSTHLPVFEPTRFHTEVEVSLKYNQATNEWLEQ